MTEAELDERAEALFASDLQPSEHPGSAAVRQAATDLLLLLGETGCAAVVAQEFGDHTENAQRRMVWARRAVRDAFVPAHV